MCQANFGCIRPDVSALARTLPGLRLLRRMRRAMDAWTRVRWRQADAVHDKGIVTSPTACDTISRILSTDSAQCAEDRLLSDDAALDRVTLVMAVATRERGLEGAKRLAGGNCGRRPVQRHCSGPTPSGSKVAPLHETPRTHESRACRYPAKRFPHSVRHESPHFIRPRSWIFCAVVPSNTWPSTWL